MKEEIPDLRLFTEHPRGRSGYRPLVHVQEWKVRCAVTSGRVCTCCGLVIGSSNWYVRVIRDDDTLEMYHYEHFWQEFGVAPS